MLETYLFISIGPFTIPSFFFFAYDLILFSQVEECQATILKKVLDSFCEYLGHMINVNKSNVCFSKGVDDVLGSNLCRILGFRRVTNFGCYLGIPLFHDKVTNSSLRFVVDKVRSKLQG